jgi:hypothetical protein
MTTISMEQGPFWEADSQQLAKKFTGFDETRRFIPVFTTLRHTTLLWARWIPSTPYFFNMHFNIILPPQKKSEF